MSVQPRALPAFRPSPGQLAVITFLGIVLLAGWPLMLVASTDHRDVVLAVVPGIAALALARLEGPGVLRRLGLDRLGWPDAYLIAIWAPTLFAVGRVALVLATGAGRLDADVGGLHPASGAPPDGEAVQRLVGAILLVPIAGAFAMVGAEIGWRAYVLTRLMPLGSWRAVTLTSLLWWAWQAPFRIDTASDRWILDVASLLVWCVLVGEILGWLYLRTRSVWAPALFSAAIAATAYLPTAVLRDLAPDAAASFGPAALAAPALMVLIVRLRSRGEIEPGA